MLVQTSRSQRRRREGPSSVSSTSSSLRSEQRSQKKRRSALLFLPHNSYHPIPTPILSHHASSLPRARNTTEEQTHLVSLSSLSLPRAQANLPAFPPPSSLFTSPPLLPPFPSLHSSPGPCECPCFLCTFFLDPDEGPASPLPFLEGSSSSEEDSSEEDSSNGRGLW